MSSVDDRIVNMQFNNKQFETGVATSTKSLTTLESTLAKTGSGQGMSTMGSSVDGVSSKFSALKVAGVAAVATIAAKATSAGLSLLKSLTIDPIIAGFKEYQTNLESVQTIMANTGEKVEVVNKGLDKLNAYSDKTIYNFGEMAKNVGTFTAAGVDLGTSIDSIKGIANLAALSGANSQQASTAMYQLSQAIASGKVGLQDWNSVVNAGMGGKQFQTALSRTAQNMGSLGDNAIKLVKEGSMEKLMVNGMSFRDSIASKPGETPWLTSGVLVETLKQVAGGYSEAELKAKGYSASEAKAIITLQKRAFDAATKIKTLPQLIQVIQESIGSSFSSIFRIVMGDFEQSKKLWTGVAFSIIGPHGFLTNFQNGLEGFFKEWAKMGGRDLALDAFGRAFSSIGKILSEVGGAFREVFPPEAGNWLFDVTKGFDSLTKSLVPSKSTLESIHTIFAGTFATFHIGFVILKAITGAITGFLGAIFANSGPATGGLLKILAAFMQTRVVMDQWISKGDKLINFMTWLGSSAGKLVGPLVQAFGYLVQAIAALASGEGMEGFMKPFEKAKGAFNEFTSAITSGISKLFAPIAQFAPMVTGGLSKAFGFLAKLAAPIEGLSSVFTLIQQKLDGFGGSVEKVSGPVTQVSARVAELKGTVGTTVDAIAGKTDQAMGSVSSNFDKARSSINGAKNSVTSMLDVVGGSKAASATKASSSLASAGEATESRWSVVKTIFSALGKGIAATFGALGVVVKWVHDQLGGLFGNMDALDWAALMNAVFTGVLIKSLKDVMEPIANFKELFKTGILGTMEDLRGTMKAYQSSLKAKMLMEIAIAIGILVASLVALSFLDPKDIAVGLGAIGAMMGMLVLSMKQLGGVQTETNLAVLASSLLLISFAMLNLAAAVLIFGHMDMETLAKGFGALAVALGLLVGAAKLMTGIEGQLVAAGAAILIISVAMQALAVAVLMFGNMDMGTLAKGLGAIAIGLILIVPSLMLLAAMGGGVAAAATAILIVATAMIALSLAVLAFGNMDMGTLAKGFGAVAIGLGLMVLSLMILAPMAPMVLIVAQSMAILSLAMIGLAIAVGMFGGMDMSTLAKGFGAVALGLTILLAAAFVAQFVAPGLIILGLALQMIGSAMLMAGLGMMAFGAGLALVTVAGTASIAIIMVAVHAFLALLPNIAVQIAASFVAFLKAIAAASPKIRTALGAIFHNFIMIIRDAIPEIKNLLQDLINAAISVIKESVPRWVEAGFTIIDEFIKSAAKHVPHMVENAMKLITGFLKAVGDQAPKVMDQAAKTIIKFVQGAADAINNNEDELRRAGLDLAWAIIDGMTGGLLSEGMQAVRDAAERIADSLPGWMKKVLHIDSPSKVTHKIGEQVAEGLARGVVSGIGSAVKAAVKMANAIISAGNDAVAKAQKLASDAQKSANLLDAKADIIGQRAEERRKAADRYARKHKEKKFKEERAQHERQARALEKLALNQRRRAEDAQEKADKTAQHVVDVRTFEEADFVGKGDIRSQAAVALAKRASLMLEKANAEAAEAKRLGRQSKAGKAMQKRSEKDAKAAKKLAADAQAAKTSANKWYQQEVESRVEDLRRQKEFEAADAAGKAAMLEQWAKENDAKAAAAAEESAKALADAIASKNAAEALRLVEQAEKAAEEARTAADEAKKQRDEAQQILNPGGGSGGSSVGAITPSRSILDDAASVLDRYTASLQQAEALAASQSNVVQFVQNNNSPKALTASEIYRQSKNLLSAAELKMGANSVKTT